MANPKQPATIGAPALGHPSLRIRPELRVPETRPGGETVNPPDPCRACGKPLADTTYHPE